MDLRIVFVDILKWLTHGIIPFVLIFLIAFWNPRLGGRFFSKIEKWFSQVARNRSIAVFLVAVFSLALCAGMSLLIRMPVPWVHDEFSYLLAADTFAHGRLTNPPHPFWEHFDTFHLLQQPTYASMYPPAQGLMLALGQVVCGLPIVGAWLSTALACAAICWMFMGWMPPRWALLGGFLAAIHPMIFTWSQSYWGGSIAVLGGALLLGGFLRLQKKIRFTDALWMGTGMAILAISRPFEGMVLALLLMVGLLGWFVRKHGFDVALFAKRILLPIVIVVALTAVWIGYYNYRVTGHALLLPAALRATQEGSAPPFVWQKQRPEPNYRHEIMRKHFTTSSLGPYLSHKSLIGYLGELMHKCGVLFPGYALNPGYLMYSVLMTPGTLQFALFVMPLPWLLRHQRSRLLIILCGIFMATLLLNETWMQPHYTAPATALVFAIVMQSIRHLRLFRWRTRHDRFVPSGLFIVRALVLLAIVTIAFQMRALSESSYWNDWAIGRVVVDRDLRQVDGKHLVIVRYNSTHSPAMEWVYNEADIDQSKVVWARDMGDEKNQKLIEYFKDRKVWLLEPDATPPKPVPYPNNPIH